MRFLITIFIIGLLAFAAGLFFPWWSIAPVAFLVVLLMPQRPGMAFLAGFLAIFLLWGIMALCLSQANHHILAQRLSPVILKMNSSLLLIIATGLIGGIVAGFAALSASLLRKRIVS
jgi:hypothetical protein